MMKATNRRCEHGFDWRNPCPHGCRSDVTEHPHCEFEVHVQFTSGAVWLSFDTIGDAQAFVADPWHKFPGKALDSDFDAARMTIYRRIVEPWEGLLEFTDHPGWHRAAVISNRESE
jgi:hypothetical protein